MSEKKTGRPIKIEDPGRPVNFVLPRETDELLDQLAFKHRKSRRELASEFVEEAIIKEIEKS